MIETCDRRRLLDLDQLDLVLTSHPRHAGRRTLIRALRYCRPFTAARRSRLERDVADWLASLPDVPAPVRNAHLDDGGGGVRWEVDFHWPRQRVVLEVNGGLYLRTPADQENDALKANWLEIHRYRQLIAPDFRFAHDRAGIHADLIALLSGP